MFSRRWLSLQRLLRWLHAGCGDSSTLQPPFVFAQAGLSKEAVAQRAAEAARAAGSSAFSTASIVGMWNIQFISKGNIIHNPSIPDGALLDFGYTQ